MTLDDRPVDVGHARQRSVLAALLVEVNRPATADLIDRVWADRLPYRARNALSACRGCDSSWRGPEVRIRAGGLCGDGRPAGGGPPRVPASRRLCMGRRPGGGACARAGAPLEAIAAMDTPWLWRPHVPAGRRFAVAWTANLWTLARRRARRADRRRAGPPARRAPGRAAHAGPVPMAGRPMRSTPTARARRLLDELGTDPGAALRRVHQQILTGDAAAPAGATRRRPGRQAGPPRPSGRRPPDRPRPASDLPVGRRASSAGTVTCSGSSPPWGRLRW